MIATTTHNRGPTFAAIRPNAVSLHRRPPEGSARNAWHGEAAELYFLKYFGSIAAVFSVSSTVSRVALNNGLNGYAFWRCFPFEQTAARFFENLMGDVPPEFDIRDLGKPPTPYANRVAPDASTRSFSDALNLAVDPHFSYAS